MKSRLRKILTVALATKIVSRELSAAYIDPSTGGQIFQLLIVIFTFFSGIILFFSRRIKTFLAQLRRGRDSHSDEEL